MNLLRALALFPAYAAWRVTGVGGAGAHVARALASGDETTRMAAGVLLVRAGAKALPLLKANLENDVAMAISLGVLGDIGGATALALVERYLDHPDTAVSRAAGNAKLAAAQAGPRG